MSKLQNILENSQYGYFQIIGGTLRIYDLYQAFTDAAMRFDTAPNYDVLKELLRNWVPVRARCDEFHSFWCSEDAVTLINEVLIPHLDDMSPEGYFFGTNQGDGSAFGWWRNEE